MKNGIQIIFAILSLIMLITIFSFSNQNGEASEGLSQKISRKIVEIVNSEEELEKLNEDDIQEKIEKVDAVIRKLAHFTIYTVLGICLILFFNTLAIENKKRIALVIIIGAIYATTDEIHQLFISERTARITDVMIDTAGVAFGIFVVTFLSKIKYFHRCKAKMFETV